MPVTNAAVNGFVQISILFVDANHLEKQSGSDPFYGGPVRQTDKQVQRWVFIKENKKVRKQELEQ